MKKSSLEVLFEIKYSVVKLPLWSNKRVEKPSASTSLSEQILHIISAERYLLSSALSKQ